MKYLTFKNMKLYVLHRSKELDHTTGRPAQGQHNIIV